MFRKFQSKKVSKYSQARPKLHKSVLNRPVVLMDNQPSLNIIDLDSIQAEIDQDGNTTPQTSHSIYRTNYTASNHHEHQHQHHYYHRNLTTSNQAPLPPPNLDEFLRSLENNARIHQRATIARPTSDNSALPVSFYSHTTTPYFNCHSRSFQHQNEGPQMANIDDDDDDDLYDSQSGYFNNIFDDNNDMHEIIEAFKPIKVI